MNLVADSLETLRRDLASRTSVHVWRVSLDDGRDGAAETDALELLSADERARASRFLRDEPRATYIATRAALRSILARYLDIEPRDLRFDIGEFGKPHIANPEGADLAFNVAHSGAIAMVAVAQARHIGVDVERVRDDVDCDALARSFFAPGEYQDIMRASPSEMRSAFFVCWARKEAYLKATGRGLSTSLASFCVSVLPGEPARLLHIDGDAAAAANWWLSDVPTAAGYVAAVAVEGTTSNVRFLDLAGFRGK